MGPLIGVRPADGLLAFVPNRLTFGLAKLTLDVLVFVGGLHIEAVRLEGVFGRDPVF